MNFIKIIVGTITSAFAGYGVFTIWPSALARWNWLGGWLAAGIIITTGWWVNHYMNAIPNEDDGAWVDMGLAIWLSALLGGSVMLSLDNGLVRSGYGIYHGASIGPALTTIILQLIGATVAGYLLYQIRKGDV
ncbi:MAG: hypothetical protein PWP45_694 [Tepidanaerobacteraceae bacterium]|nr:hypothetical protein [Tepidanaerobacteraceae bacterium]